MKKVLMKPVEMTPAIMRKLEQKGCIIRLRPKAHELNPRAGETVSEDLYVSDKRFGPHKLITVTVNRAAFAAFGTHPDNEEFLLIGDPRTKPMYLAVALCKKNELARKIKTRKLSARDFICLRVKYNDPEVSFFVMLKDVPHGEATVAERGKPGSFYVTEPACMGYERTDFGEFELAVAP